MNRFKLSDVEEGLRGLRSCLERGEVPPPPDTEDLDIIQLLVEHVRLGKLLNSDDCVHTCDSSISPDCKRCRVVGRMGVIEMLAED